MFFFNKDNNLQGLLKYSSQMHILQSLKFLFYVMLWTNEWTFLKTFTIYFTNKHAMYHISNFNEKLNLFTGQRKITS